MIMFDTRSGEIKISKGIMVDLYLMTKYCLKDHMSWWLHARVDYATTKFLCISFHF